MTFFGSTGLSMSDSPRKKTSQKKKDFILHVMRLAAEARMAEDLELKRREQLLRRRKQEEEELRRKLEQFNRDQEQRLDREVEIESSQRNAKYDRLMSAVERLESQSSWQRYIECNPLPDVHDETQLHTFLSSWSEEVVEVDSTLSLQPILEKCYVAELVVSLLQVVLGEALEEEQHERYAWVYEYIRALRAVTKYKLDVATQMVLAEADGSPVEDAAHGTVATAYATDALSLGIWVHTHTTRDRRVKQVVFPELAIELDLPAALQNCRTAFRVLRTPFNALFEEHPPETPLPSEALALLHQCLSHRRQRQQSAHTASAMLANVTIARYHEDAELDKQGMSVSLPLSAGPITLSTTAVVRSDGLCGNASEPSQSWRAPGPLGLLAPPPTARLDECAARGGCDGEEQEEQEQDTAASEEADADGDGDGDDGDGDAGSALAPELHALVAQLRADLAQYAPRDDCCWAWGHQAPVQPGSGPSNVAQPPAHLLSPSLWVSVGGVLIIEQLAVPAPAKRWHGNAPTLREHASPLGELAVVAYPAEDAPAEETPVQRERGASAEEEEEEEEEEDSGGNGGNGNGRRWSRSSHARSLAGDADDDDATTRTRKPTGIPADASSWRSSGYPHLANAHAGTRAAFTSGSTDGAESPEVSGASYAPRVPPSRGVRVSSGGAVDVDEEAGAASRGGGSSGSSASGSGTSGSTQGPVTVTFSLPADIALPCARPLFACWDATHHGWDPAKALLLAYDSASRRATVQLAALQPLAVLAPRFADAPFRFWGMRPAGINRVHVTLQGSRYPIELEVSGLGVRLLGPNVPELRAQLGVWLPPGLLMHRLALCGVHLCHGERAHSRAHTAVPWKHASVRDLLVSEAACLAGICELQSHPANCHAHAGGSAAYLWYRLVPAAERITAPAGEGDDALLSAKHVSATAVHAYVNTLAARANQRRDGPTQLCSGSNVYAGTRTHVCVCEELPCVCGATRRSAASGDSDGDGAVKRALELSSPAGEAADEAAADPLVALLRAARGRPPSPVGVEGGPATAEAGEDEDDAEAEHEEDPLHACELARLEWAREDGSGAVRVCDATAARDSKDVLGAACRAVSRAEADAAGVDGGSAGSHGHGGIDELAWLDKDEEEEGEGEDASMICPRVGAKVVVSAALEHRSDAALYRCEPERGIALEDLEEPLGDEWGVLHVREDGIRVCLREDERRLRGVRGGLHVCASRAIGEACGARSRAVRALTALVGRLEERLAQVKGNAEPCAACEHRRRTVEQRIADPQPQRVAVLQAELEELALVVDTDRPLAESASRMPATGTLRSVGQAEETKDAVDEVDEGEADNLDFEGALQSTCPRCVQNALRACSADAEIEAEAEAQLVHEAINAADYNTLLTQLTLRKLITCVAPFCASV